MQSAARRIFTLSDGFLLGYYYDVGTTFSILIHAMLAPSICFPYPQLAVFVNMLLEPSFAESDKYERSHRPFLLLMAAIL